MHLICGEDEDKYFKSRKHLNYFFVVLHKKFESRFNLWSEIINVKDF